VAVEIGGGLTGYRTASGEVTIPLQGSTLEHMPAGAEPVQFTGRGKVLTYTIVGVPTTRFKSKAPYTLAVIELNEGARLLALVDGATPSIDARVRFTRKDEFGYHFELS